MAHFTTLTIKCPTTDVDGLELLIDMWHEGSKLHTDVIGHTPRLTKTGWHSEPFALESSREEIQQWVDTDQHAQNICHRDFNDAEKAD